MIPSSNHNLSLFSKNKPYLKHFKKFILQTLTHTHTNKNSPKNSHSTPVIFDQGHRVVKLLKHRSLIRSPHEFQAFLVQLDHHHVRMHRRNGRDHIPFLVPLEGFFSGEIPNPRDPPSPCQMMIVGVYNHLRNERSLGSIKNHSQFR